MSRPSFENVFSTKRSTFGSILRLLEIEWSVHFRCLWWSVGSVGQWYDGFGRERMSL